MSATVFWITGLSGAGKTTVASRLVERLRAVSQPALLLDGDVLRAIFAPDAAHSPEERFRLAMSYGRLCREVSAQGIYVVCATVSMFHAVREWNRQNILGYREIYLRVPIDELRRRDAKGLYGAVQRGDSRNLVGVDIPAELPENPDLVIDNHSKISADSTVGLIWDVFVEPKRGNFGK